VMIPTGGRIRRILNAAESGYRKLTRTVSRNWIRKAASSGSVNVWMPPAGIGRKWLSFGGLPVAERSTAGRRNMAMTFIWITEASSGRGLRKHRRSMRDIWHGRWSKTALWLTDARSIGIFGNTTPFWIVSGR